MNPEVDAYVSRSEQWPDEISVLRPILADCGLAEAIDVEEHVERILAGKGLRDR